jgi:hypothetical protein
MINRFIIIEIIVRNNSFYTIDKAIYELCSIELFGGERVTVMFIYNIYMITARYSVFRFSSEIVYIRR